MRAILEDFGLDPDTSHIINGHVPVRKGESPIKCGGRLFVIDGGISKAYQSTTGIAGYTLIFNSHSLTLAEHRPFQPATGTSVARTDTKTRVVEAMPHRILCRKPTRERQSGPGSTHWRPCFAVTGTARSGSGSPGADPESLQK